ncbi:MAG: Ig domain-containing protein [Candidatus Acidiferrales bacterium]
MKSRARFTSLLAFIILALLQFSACSGTPSTFNKVTISPSGTMYLGQGGTIPLISATVLNDTQLNGGVTFSLLPVGVGSGTLTQLTSTTASFAAPGVVTAETIVTITATSVDFPKQFAVLTVKIEPPPSITTTSVPDATLDTAYTAPITATGGVPPLSWSLSSGTLPTGLTLGSSKTDTVNITGKATVAGAYTFTVTVTDATGASSTSGQLQIVVSSLAFTTTSPLPSGTVGVAYAGVQFAATGGTPPYAFSLANGSNLPPGLQLNAGDLTGTPTTVGNYSFGVSVTDSENPAAVITNTFTLVVNPVQDLTLLTGSYAFNFSGNNASGFVAAAGTFTTDGNGNITTGEADITNLQNNTLYKSITGTYTAGQDGRGTITFTSVTGAPTFAFAIDTGGSGHGRLIEFDAAPIVTRGSGRLEAQSVTTCVVTGTGTNTYAGTFAFGGSGYASNFAAGGAGPIGFAGTFTAIPPISPATQGSLGNGEMDSNAPNNVLFGNGGNSISGVYQSGPDATHCTLGLSAAGLSNPNYDVYPISFSDAFMIETDTVNGNTPNITTAEMKQQFGQPFNTGSMSGAMAGGVSGSVLSGSYVPYVSVMQMVSSSGSGSFQILLSDNEGGIVSGTNGTPFAVTYTADQFGRVDTGGFTVNGVFQPIFYLVSDDEAFVVSMLSGGPISGHLDTQTLSHFTTASINGTLVEGTSAPAVSADQNFSGYLTFDGSVTPATINGVQDVSTSSANTSAEAVTGTYVLSNTGAVDGSGTVTLTSPAASTAAFYIVSPTKMVMITTTTGDTHPVLVIVGH